MNKHTKIPAETDYEHAALQIDPAGTIWEANHSADSLFGFERAGLIGENIGAILPPSGRNKLNRLFEQVKNGTGHLAVKEMRGFDWRGRNGNKLELTGSFLAVRQKLDQSFVLVFNPVHEHSRGEHTSYYSDPITGLPSQQLFRDRLSQSVFHSERHKEILALMILDFKNFEELCLPFASPLRDNMLQEIARRICACVRADDTVCRLRKGRFAIIYPQIKNEASASYLAHKILRAFESPLVIEEKLLQIFPLLGISIYPNDGPDPKALLEKAEMALLQVRSSANYFGFYNVSLHEKAIRRQKLETGLRMAVNQHELRIFFQPKLSLREMQICGAEALVRWERPGSGLVCPTDFIPIAEDTGLILDIGRWVLRQACRQNKKWQMEGMKPFPVSVNLSMRQLNDENLNRLVTEILEETGLHPQFLELEVTESAVMENAGKAIATLRQLNQLGIQTGLDDFGTGYSSLSYISKLPCQFVKIDKSFIKNVCQDAASQSIIKTIAEMARALRLRTVIEGVETKQQLEFCIELGCDQVQGFLIGHPVPADAIDWLARADGAVAAAGRYAKI